MRLLRLIQHLAWSYHSGVFLTGVERTGAERRILVLLAAGVLAGAMRWLLRQRRPSGHVAELSAAIWFRSGRLPPLSTLVRAVLSIVLVALGASLGREAAPKQAGAVIASACCESLGLSSVERRLLVACAAGGGMAAVYNVPFGGALFALEVLLGSLALPLIAPALATSMIATATAWLLLPNVPTYALPTYSVSAPLIAWAVLAGPLAGLLSVLYVRAIAWADARKPQRRWLLVMPVIVFACLGATAVHFPQILGNGKDLVQLTFLGAVPFALVLPLLALKLLATCACLASGAPGGLFTPTMTCGALLGALLGSLWAALGGAAAAGSCAVVGAAAVLAASTQGPISALVLVLELTRHGESLMVPMLLAVAGAVWVARRLEPRSIYSGRIQAGRSAAHARLPSTLPAAQRLICRDYVSVSAAARYPEVLEQSIRSAGRPLYVLDEHGEPVGALDSTRLRALKLKPIQRVIATAADLAAPAVTLSSSLDDYELARALKRSGKTELAVVDAGSGALIGVVRTPPPRGQLAPRALAEAALSSQPQRR